MRGGRVIASHQSGSINALTGITGATFARVSLPWHCRAAESRDFETVMGGSALAVDAPEITAAAKIATVSDTAVIRRPCDRR